MKKLLLLAEQGFTFVTLMLFSGGPLNLLLSGGAVVNEAELSTSSGDDHTWVKLLFLALHVISYSLLVVRWKKVIYALSKDRYIWVLTGLVLLSLFWSVAPSKTLVRGFGLVGTTAFGFYFATRYSMRQQLQMLAWVFGISIVLSLLFGVALPQYGVVRDQAGVNWRGIYVHKNLLGSTMSLSAVIFFILASETKRNRLPLWCGLSFSVILVILSTSKTSLLKLVQVLGLIFVCRTLRWRYSLMIPALIGLVTVGGIFFVWFAANADTLLGSIGKDTTLTGRTDLWPLVWELIWKRPWLGYGYSALWLGWDSETAYIWWATTWAAPNAHNGFLEILLQLGIVGLSIFLLGFCTNSVKALAWIRLCRSRTSEVFWPIAYMAYTILSNLTEAEVLLPNSLNWVLFVSVTISSQMLFDKQTQIVE
jgi:O-antigen ligase